MVTKLQIWIFLKVPACICKLHLKLKKMQNINNLLKYMGSLPSVSHNVHKIKCNRIIEVGTVGT